jgi:hypothetical protein
VPKGADQPVAARLVGFDASEVLFFSRYESNGKWEQSRMAPDSDSGGYAFLFLDLNDNVRYYVQAGRVRSPEFGIQVKGSPEVQRINLVYHYPAYTGPRPARGRHRDITALKGTVPGSK